jgi:hypothetical protein
VANSCAEIASDYGFVAHQSARLHVHAAADAHQDKLQADLPMIDSRFNGLQARAICEIPRHGTCSAPKTWLKSVNNVPN